MRLIALLCCLLLSTPALAATPAESASIRNLRPAEVHWSAYQTQTANCRSASPVIDLAERHTITLQRQLATMEDRKAAGLKVPLAPAAACNSSEHNAVQGASQIMAWEALVRLDYYFQLSGMNAWTNGLSEVKVYNSVAAATLSRQVQAALVAQNGQAAVDARKEALRQEVVAVLMIMCPVRRPGGARCPELPAELKGQQELAHARLLDAEQLATELAKVDDAIKRGEVGTPWRIAKNAKDDRTACRAGDKVIYPQAPDTHPGAIIGNFMARLRDWGKWSDGTIVTVRDEKPGYSLLISPELGVTVDDKTPRPLFACRLD